ncbi:MAG: type II toxin-antitoxin system VapC family toxin [Candidatus Dormibacteria bacterium]
MRAVLDTSVLLARDAGPLEGELAVSAATFAELHFGALVARDARVRAERLRQLTLLQLRFVPIPVDAEVAMSYGLLASTVVRSGRKMRPRVMDLLIAATAHSRHARLYTRNPKDLTGLEGLLEVVSV